MSSAQARAPVACMPPRGPSACCHGAAGQAAAGRAARSHAGGGSAAAPRCRVPPAQRSPATRARAGRAPLPSPCCRALPAEPRADPKQANQARVAGVLQRLQGRRRDQPARRGGSGDGGGAGAAAAPPAPSGGAGRGSGAPDGAAGAGAATPPAAGAPRRLPLAQLLAFEREGHVCTRRLLPAAEVAGLAVVVAAEAAARELGALRHRARVLAPGAAPAALATPAAALALLRSAAASDELGFLQVFNLHRCWDTYPTPGQPEVWEFEVWEAAVLALWIFCRTLTCTGAGLSRTGQSCSVGEAAGAAPLLQPCAHRMRARAGSARPWPRWCATRAWRRPRPRCSARRGCACTRTVRSSSGRGLARRTGTPTCAWRRWIPTRSSPHGSRCGPSRRGIGSGCTQERARVRARAQRGKPPQGLRRRLRPVWARCAEARPCEVRRTSSATSAGPGLQSEGMVPRARGWGRGVRVRVSAAAPNL